MKQQKPSDFYSTLGVTYDNTQTCGYLSIPVLSFLKGLKWGKEALAYVHGLRPSQIRVTQGECKANATLWRVTVFVDKEDIILGIEQEIEVTGIGSGNDTEQALPELQRAALYREEDFFNRAK